MVAAAEPPTSTAWLRELVRAHSGLVPNDPDEEITDQNFVPVPPRAISTDPLLAEVAVKNMRDLASASSLLKAGMVFRSSCPTDARESDWQVIVDQLGIRTMIDLRSKREVKMDPHHERLEGANIWAAERINGSTAQARLVKGAAEPGDSLSFFRISIHEALRYMWEFMWRIPIHRSLAVVLFTILYLSMGLYLGRKPGHQLEALILREVNREGMLSMYSIILDVFGPEIALAMQVVLDSLKVGRPVLLYCTLGKDRTGLLTALVLACCGVSEREIISDYVRSAASLDARRSSGRDFDVTQFTRAPAEAMAHALDHFNSVYGSPSDYLRRFGFHTGLQEELGVILTGSVPRIYLDDHHH